MLIAAIWSEWDLSAILLNVLPYGVSSYKLIQKKPTRYLLKIQTPMWVLSTFYAHIIHSITKGRSAGDIILSSKISGYTDPYILAIR